MKSGTVVVTGASGFIGRSVCPRLAAEGWRVRAVVRDASRTPEGASDTVVVQDLADSDLDSVVQGADAVIHLAARVHQLHETAPDPLAEYRRVNRDATLRLADAAAKAKLRRFVFISSIKAAGDRSGDTPLKESDPPNPDSPYGLSKLEAERELEQRFGSSPMSVISLRLPLVYGPGALANFERLLSSVRSGFPLPIASVRNRRSVLYLENAVDVMIAGLRKEDVRGTFFVNDGEDASTADLVRYLAAGMKLRPRLLPFPVALLRLAGTLTGRSEDFDRITRSLATDCSALQSALDWKPPVPMAEGLRRTAEWYVSKKSQG